jgi:hypothetical protein
MAFIDPLLSNNPPTKGNPLSVKLTKTLLQADSAFISATDSYFADSTNWKYVLITMQSSEGKETEVMMFDCDNLDDEVYTDFLISTTARDAWEVQTLVVTDFDGGYMRLTSKDGQLNPADFNFIIGGLPLDPPTENSDIIATFINNTSIQLDWINGVGTNTGSRLAYQIGTNPPVDCSGGIDVGSVNSYIVTGLSPETEYSFRLCSYNGNNIDSSGITMYSTTELNAGLLTWSGDRAHSNYTRKGVNGFNIANHDNQFFLNYIYHGGTISVSGGGKHYYEIVLEKNSIGQLAPLTGIIINIVDNISDLFSFNGFIENGIGDSISDTVYWTKGIGSGSLGSRNSNNFQDPAIQTPASSVGDTVCVAIDLDNNQVHVGINGAYNSNPDLATGGITINATKAIICPSLGGDVDTIATINQTAQFTIPTGFTYIS